MVNSAHPCIYNLSQKQSKCPWQCCETVQNVLLIPLSAGLRFFTVLRLAMNPNLIFEIGQPQFKGFFSA